MEYLSVSLPVLCLLVNVVVQVMGARYAPSLGMLRSVFLGFAAGLAGVVIIDGYISVAMQKTMGDAISLFVVDLITYAALGYCYFHFINLGETARRIRILRELYESKEGLTESEILEHYNAADALSLRRERLLANGQIIYNNGTYYIGRPAVLHIARLITMLKVLITGRKSEFDGK